MTQNNNPNVIFILTDDQGHGDLACHGNPLIQTPNLDKLHDESMRFTDFHVGPLCAPTRAGLMTGHYHDSTGVWHTIMGRSLLRKNEMTIADIFKANGYKTALFGKWHLGDNYPFRPQDRGFEVVKYHGGGGIGQTPDYWGNDYFDDTYYCNDGVESFSGYCTDVWFEEASKFMEKNKNNPFFLYIPVNAPHSPFNVAEKYYDLYKENTKEYRAKFYGMITNIDENVGELRNKIKELGIEENTILIFMTDNGTDCGCTLNGNGFIIDGFNAGMRGMKGSEYDGGHRVPFFLSFPAMGFIEGKDIKPITSYVDILPTLIDLCDLKEPEGYRFHGRSLKSLLFGEIEEWPERVIFTDNQWDEYPVKWKKSAVMTSKWRLINGKELYNIEKDPGQVDDIVEKNPEILKLFREHYEKWWEGMEESYKIECPIEIGSEYEKESRLTCHDWHGKSTAWNQGIVRKGLIFNGYWTIDILKEGVYQFELRRWPKEENRSITEGIPKVERKPYQYFNWYSGGKALNITSAGIKVGYMEKSKRINSIEKAVSFTLNLKEGLSHLNAWFQLENGTRMGVYYIYIKKLTHSLD